MEFLEGQLGESDYRFQILRPSGYGITTRNSTGLEPNNVNLWLMRKLSVAFVEESSTRIEGGMTFTEINEKLKILYFRVILDDKNKTEPKLMFGVFYQIKKNKESVKKFENLMGAFEYSDNKIFAKYPDVDFEDGTLKIEGKFNTVNLLEINSSNELMEKVIQPAILIYENIQ